MIKAINENKKPILNKCFLGEWLEPILKIRFIAGNKKHTANCVGVNTLKVDDSADKKINNKAGK